MGSAVRGGKTFARAWDRFVLAWPFSRVAVVLGAPLPADASCNSLAEAIGNANRTAEAMLPDVRRKMLPLHGFSALSGPDPQVLERD